MPALHEREALSDNVFADTNGYDLEIQIIVGVVSVIVILIPIFMRRNTKQHNIGKEERSEQTVLLNTLIENQGYIKGNIETIVRDVGEVKKVNTELKETVTEHGREIKRISSQLNKD